MIGRDAKICKLYKKGLVARKIAKQLGISRARVWQILQKENIRYKRVDRVCFLGITISYKALRALRKQAVEQDVSVSKVAADYINKGLKLKTKSLR